MKIKDKIKSYSFWVSLASAVILILKILGNRFGFTVDETMVSDLFTALCSVLVLLGIIVVPVNQSYNTQQEQNKIENPKNNLDVEYTESESIDSNNINSNQITESQNKFIVLDNIENQNSTKNHTKQDMCFNYETTALELQTKKTETTKNAIFDNSSIQDPENTCRKFEDEKLFEQSNNNSEHHIIEIGNNNTSTQESNIVNSATNISDSNSEENNNNALNQNTISEFKEMLNLKRADFSKNINDYIFELQEEIRKAREQM